MAVVPYVYSARQARRIITFHIKYEIIRVGLSQAATGAHKLAYLVVKAATDKPAKQHGIIVFRLNVG